MYLDIVFILNIINLLKILLKKTIFALQMCEIKLLHLKFVDLKNGINFGLKFICFTNTLVTDVSYLICWYLDDYCVLVHGI